MKVEIDKIYKKHGKYVYNVALSVLKNKTDAEDILQDVFIKFFESINSFRGEADIKTYLYRMTVNKCIDLIRKENSKRNKIEEIYKISSKNNKNYLLLFNIIEKLNENEKLPLLLSEIAGFSYKEISEILNIKLGTVKSRINRAINKLKVILDEEEKIL